jgi:hypothetical protein
VRFSAASTKRASRPGGSWLANIADVGGSQVIYLCWASLVGLHLPRQMTVVTGGKRRDRMHCNMDQETCAQTLSIYTDVWTWLNDSGLSVSSEQPTHWPRQAGTMPLERGATRRPRVHLGGVILLPWLHISPGWH